MEYTSKHPLFGAPGLTSRIVVSIILGFLWHEESASFLSPFPTEDKSRHDQARDTVSANDFFDFSCKNMFRATHYGMDP